MRKTYAECVRVCVSVRESEGVTTRKRKRNLGVTAAVAWDTQAQGEKKKRERSDRDQMFGLSPRRARQLREIWKSGNQDLARGTCGNGPDNLL